MGEYRNNVSLLFAVFFLSVGCGDTASGDGPADGGPMDVNQPMDSATPQECTGENAGAVCDDGDACTINDLCSALGRCEGEARTCLESDGNPCTEPRCDADPDSPENGTCVETPITVDAVENACNKYRCTDGVQEQLGPSTANDCDSWVVPEGGCIDHYVCDPAFTDENDGSHCRPVSKANGAPCLLDGVGVKAATDKATADESSACAHYVCHAEPPANTALTTAQCVLSSTLGADTQSALENAGSTLFHRCSLDDMPDIVSAQCNDWRCGCKDDACTEAECQVDPQESKVGKACNNGDGCDASVCMPAKGAGAVMECESGAADPIVCDLFPNATCDVSGPCNPDTGCPNTMDIEASNAQCQINNACIESFNTKCAPNDPNADPATGCVVSYLPVGSPCGEALKDGCVLEASCQTAGESMKCEITQWVNCDDGNACTKDFCADGQCQTTPLPGACDDNDACTTNDQCTENVCTGQPVDCIDGVDCTTDSCKPGAGCQQIANDTACNDNNPCTADECDAQAGCQNPHVTNGTECSDDGTQWCQDGICVAKQLCGDGKIDAINGENCDDNNQVTEICPYGQTNCTVCSASCTLVDGATTYCGDGDIDATNGENCDDNNPVTETCPYGQTSCTVCSASCTLVDGATSFCGDNNIDSANGEECDDGATPDPATCTADCTSPGLPPTGPPNVYAWTDNGVASVNRVNLTTGQTTMIAGGQNWPSGIARDPVNNTVYWSLYTKKSIARRALPDGPILSFTTPGEMPAALAFDPGGPKLYWTETVGSALRRSNPDGSGIETLVTGLSFSVGLDLDLSAGKIYWSDESNNIIRRANLDGSGVENVVTSGLNMPRGIAVAQGRVYWVDRGTQTVRHQNVNGGSVSELASGFIFVQDVDVDPNAQLAYVAEDGSGSPGAIYTVSLQTGQKNVLVSGLGNPKQGLLWYDATP